MGIRPSPFYQSESVKSLVQTGLTTGIGYHSLHDIVAWHPISRPVTAEEGRTLFWACLDFGAPEFAGGLFY